MNKTLKGYILETWIFENRVWKCGMDERADLIINDYIGKVLGD